MNKKMTWLATGTAMMLMGMSMPSCPGQQAMQQQIDTLQTKSDSMNRQLMQLDAANKTMASDFAKTKELLTQVSNTALAQRQAIEQMDVSIKALNQRLTAPPKPAPKASAKKAATAKRKH